MAKTNKAFDNGEVDITETEVDEVETVEDIEESDEEDVQDEPQKNIIRKESNAVAETQPLNIGFNFDEEELPGVQTVEMGTDVKGNPVERIKFSEGKRSVISILSNNPVTVKMHYVKGLGSFLSAGPEFIDICGMPYVRYLFPIIEYDTDKKGRIVSADVNFKVLSVGQRVYEDLKTIQLANGQITGLDLIVTCKREDTQEISIMAAGQAQYTRSAKVVNEAKAFWKDNSKNMILAVARKISLTQLENFEAEEEDVTEAAGRLPKGGNSGKNVNFTTVFD